MARLGQVIKKLNIGIATAVDFLKQKGFDLEQNPNAKLTDEQNDLLIREFRKDQNMKMESERISQQRQDKEKPSSVAIDGFDQESVSAPTEIKIEVERPHVKIVDKIDVEDKHKRAAVKPVEKEEKPVVEAPKQVVEKPVVVEKAPEVIVPEPVVELVPEQVVEVKAEPKVEVKPIVEEILHEPTIEKQEVEAPGLDRKSPRLNSSHFLKPRLPSYA